MRQAGENCISTPYRLLKTGVQTIFKTWEYNVKMFKTGICLYYSLGTAGGQMVFLLRHYILPFRGNADCLFWIDGFYPKSAAQVILLNDLLPCVRRGLRIHWQSPKGV